GTELHGREGIDRTRLAVTRPGPRWTGTCRGWGGDGRYARRPAPHATYRRAGDTGCAHRRHRTVDAGVAAQPDRGASLPEVVGGSAGRRRGRGRPTFRDPGRRRSLRRVQR